MKSFLYLAPILLATLSATAYQIVQKNIRANAHPLLSVRWRWLILWAL